MYLWKCTCADCGREFDWYDNYPPLECVKCESVEIKNEFKGRAYDKMTQAERIREYYKDHPTASCDEVAEVVGTTNSNVRANLAKDIKAGRCVRLEDKSYDYSPYYNHTQALTELVDWKNDTRREWVDMLTRAAEKETDSNVMRLLIKEANKLMKEVTK